VPRRPRSHGTFAAMALKGLEPVVPKLTKAAEPILVPVPAGAVKVLPRWAEEDNVLRWRVRYRVPESGEPDATGMDFADADNGKPWAELELRPFTRDLPLTGLQHGVRHYFVAAIQTHDGWSDWSRIVSCVPPSPELPGKCAAVFAMVVDETTALVRWTRPIDFAASVSCGHVVKYKLRVSWTPGEGERDKDCAREILIEDDCEEFEVRDLECCRDYRFQIAGQNVTGWGDWSDHSAVLLMPLPVPLAPPPPALRRATHHSAVIQWQHPATGDAPIESFRFRYTTRTWALGFQEVHDVPANLSQYVIDGLETGETYTFQVRAVNKYGLGIWSDNSIPIKTLDGSEPSKIAKLSVPNIYKSFITLQWPPADENGYEVTRHLVRCSNTPQMDDSEELEPPIQRANGFDKCDLRHLQKKTYYFQVAAFNKLGMGEWSDPVMVDLVGALAVQN